MPYLPAERLKLYRDFKAMEVNNFHGMVRYYEQYEAGMRLLDFEEYFDCTVTYTEALFQTGDYSRHLVMCDHLLEIVIMENLETWGGEDLYVKLLFRRAASLYHLHEFPKAEHVLRELLKINPHHRLARRFLHKVLLRQKPAWLLKVRAVFVMLTLLTAVIIALEIFVVRPFFPDWYREAQWVRVLVFFAGVAVLLVGEFRHAWRSEHATESFVRRVKQRKNAGNDQ